MRHGFGSRIVANYVLAVFLVIIATILRQTLGTWFGVTAPFVTIYPAVILTVLICNAGAALLAASLGGIITSFLFMHPTGLFQVYASRDIATLVIYGLSSLFLVMIARRLKAASDMEARKESEERFRAIYENSMDGILLTVPDTGEIIQANPAALSMIGMTEEELRKIGRTGLTVPDEALAQALEERSRLGKWRGELTFRRKDGSTFPVELSSNFFRGPDGKALSSMSFKDITEQKKAREELKEREERYRIMGETLPYGVWLCDPKGGARYVSQSFLDLLDMTQEEQQQFGWTKRLPSEDVEPMMKKWLHCIETGEPWDSEHRVLGPDGKYHTVLTRGLPVRNEKGGITCWVGINLDIDERKKTEEALRRSEARLRRFFDSGMLGVIYWTIDGRIKDANDKFLEMVGYTRDDLKEGRVNSDEITPPEYRQQDEYSIGELKAAGISSPYEKEYFRKDGSRIPIMVGAAMLEVSPSEAVAFVLDITERRRAEETLRQSRADLDRAQQVGQIGSWRLDVRRNVLTWSDETYHIFGVAPGTSLSYEAFLEMVHPDDREYVAVQWDAGIRGEPYDIEHRIVTDGQVKWVREKAYLEFDEAGLLGGFGITQDITERKRIEEELRRAHDELELRVQERTAELEESKQRYHDLAELLPETVFEIDGLGYLTYANRHALESFGYTAGDIERGLHIRDIVVEKDYDDVIAKATTILEGKGPEHGEYTVRRKDGSEFPASIHASSIEHKGQIAGLRGVATDLTERRKMEERLRQAQKMEAVGTLAGGIAHDFNNMLAVILGNSELALDDLDDNDGPRRNVEQIFKASKRARDLVKQILTFSRKTESGKRPLHLTPLFKETVKLLRGVLPTTIDIDLRINTAMDSVLGDPSQLQQVLMNLATNAAHAMRENGGTLIFAMDQVTVMEVATPDQAMQAGTYIKLTVQDTGTGMKKEVLDRIFEPFFTTKEAGQGTGMGLAVVYGIVKGHNGAITVDSKPGVGSTFTVFLPYTRTVSASAQEEAGDVPIGKERILFVDDEPDIVQTVSQSLQRLGYHVTAASNAREALTLFRSHHFDLVITDQTMPDITGIALAEELLKEREDIPIILFTGYSETVSAEKAKSAGISDFILKPIDKREMAEAVRRALDRKSAANN